jgi:uncharacterized protein
LTPLEWIAAGVIVFAGSILQGAVGFGVGMLSAPLLVLIDPMLVPGPLLSAALVLTMLIAFRERRAIDFHGVGWALVGRVPGAIVGAAVVAMVPPRQTSIVVGAMVFIAVGIIASGASIPRTRRALLGAGGLSGFMATTASIGGPAIAILYQDESGKRIRGTLSGFFLVGLLVSLAALAVVGRFGTREMEASLLLCPGALAGFFASARVARALDRGHTRTAVLVVSALAGLSALVEALVSHP